MKQKSMALIALSGLFVLSVEAGAADIDYNVTADETYEYCLELARDEANANIGMVYLHPPLVQGDEAAVAEKQVLKQRKHEAQREQRKEKCI